MIAAHVIFGTYGFWLPNDPRGSWSEFVGSWDLFQFGSATKVTTRHSLAAKEHDVRERKGAKQALKHPPVILTGRQALAVVAGFREAITESGYVCDACAILPEHVHLVLQRHPRDIVRIVGHLKGRATQRLKNNELWPDGERPVWSRGCWKVFLETPEDVWRAIRYVEENPVRDGERRQVWRFVTPFDG